MKQNIIVDVCTLWLLLPMVEMERVRKEPTNTCTEGEFEQIAGGSGRLRECRRTGYCRAYLSFYMGY